MRDGPATAAGQAARVGVGFRVGLAASSFGVLAALLTPAQILLPLQAAELGGASKAGTLALVSSFGGLAGIVAAPLVGMVSDRTRSRYGRRRTWVLASAAAGALGLAGLAAATSVPALILAFGVLQIGIGGVIASSLALVSDQVPRRQRGEVSAVFGVAGALSPVFGAWVFSLLGGDVPRAYLVLGVLMLGGGLLLLVTVREPSSSSDAVRPWDWQEWLACLRLSPRRDPDLGWMWLTRFLVFLGLALSLGFGLYWVQEVLGPGAGPAEVAEYIAVSTTVYALVAVVSGIVAGVVSDRLMRRKAFVVGAGLVLSVCSVANLAWPTWTGILVVAAVTGLAFGVYSTMDLAVAADVLPRAGERARDLGVLQSANTFPSLAGPALGAVMLSGAGFTGLYAAAALCMAGAAFTVTRITAIR
ncbi:MFS transporter [Nonomuraea sp. NPDC059023]|uniref:MFS transporter n=1 Tax=unclassified Nonomuraea TaxID=2593643 RepID=UPI00367B704E